jgi:uncharacterized protein YyaL (SSP411 family)
MTLKGGGFYSAEDADSDSEEGKYYVWTINELKAILDRDELKFAVEVFNLDDMGNFIDSVSRKKTGGNILFLKESKIDLANKLDLKLKQFEKLFEKIRKKLYVARRNRTAPHKDDKILTDWNGLMIAALAKGAQAFENEDYLNAAENAAALIKKRLLTKTGRLLHRFRDGDSAVTGFLNDYAFLIWGLIELYEATFKMEYLTQAKELNIKMLEHFWDYQNGGLFFTAADSEELLLRSKETYDGAIPSGNSVAFYNLLRLSRLTKDHTLEEKASELAKAISNDVRRFPIAHSQLMLGLDFAIGPTYEVLLDGDVNGNLTKQMLHALRTNFLPNKIVHMNMRPGDFSMKEELFKLPDPSITNISNMDSSKKLAGTKAYVCVNYSCQKPTSDISEMLAQLGNKSFN